MYLLLEYILLGFPLLFIHKQEIRSLNPTEASIVLRCPF